MAIKSHTTSSLAIAAAICAFASPAFAWGIGLHPDGWYKVNRAGWAYWMPPAVCTIGYIAPHGVVYQSSGKMEHMFGKGALGGLVIDSYGMKIFVNNDVPSVVQRDNLIHEEAEARGCGDDPVDRQHAVGG